MALHRRILHSDALESEDQGQEEGKVVRRAWNKGKGGKQMDLALRDVASRRAAQVYNIPKSTLHDHNCGNVCPGAGVVLPRYLSDEEEELVRWLDGCAEVYRVCKDCARGEGSCRGNCGKKNREWTVLWSAMAGGKDSDNSTLTSSK